MDRPPYEPDPNALTQPIPVVPVAPPRPRVATAVAAPSFVHRFGSVPWYLFARFVAFVLDYFVVAFVVATFAFHAVEAGLLLFAGRSAAGFGTLVVASFAIAIVFAFASESIFGTTLGKSIFALVVRRWDGRRPAGWRIIVRALLRPIDLLLIGPLLALVTPRHQRLGDVFAGTVVAVSRLGAFASLIGIVLGCAVAYAQVTFGGGLTSIVGVAAEAAVYAPAAYERAASAFGVVVPQPATIATPQAQATGATATPSPVTSGSANI